MYEITKTLHHYIAFIALILLAWATINGIIGTTSEKIFEEKHRKINVFALIATHTQLVLGLILLLISPVAQTAFANMGAAMKDSYTRQMVVEHPFVNIIAVILVTIGNARAKKSIGNGRKFKQSAIFYGIALLLILTRIPWSVLF